MINFAHRGFKGKYPENTMLAFKKAMEAGADAIELDVHLTKDDELVIIHDETVDRTTNGSGFVKDMTLEELKNLSASVLFKEEEIQTIPTLKEYLDYAKANNIPTNIELKNSMIEYKDIEQKVYDMLVEYNLVETTIISSFNHESLVRMKKIDPNIRCGVLTWSKLYEPWAYTKNMGMEYYHPINYTVDERIIEECNKLGIGVNMYMDESDYYPEIEFALNPHGLITDYPNRVRDMISKDNNK